MVIAVENVAVPFILARLVIAGRDQAARLSLNTRARAGGVPGPPLLLDVAGDLDWFGPGLAIIAALRGPDGARALADPAVPALRRTAWHADRLYLAQSA